MANEAAPHTLSVLTYRMDVHEATLVELKDFNKSIAASLQVLVVLEQRHNDTREAMERAFKVLEAQSKRLADVEACIPVVLSHSKTIDRLQGVVWALALAAITGGFALLWYQNDGMVSGNMRFPTTSIPK